MMRIRSVRAAALAVLASGAALVAACDDEPLAPPPPSAAMVAGEYDAADTFGALTFTTTSDGATTDWLAAGAALNLTLGADGTVAGRLFIPGAEEDGSDMDADMAGTWTLTGTTVELEQEADTFVRDMPFTFNEGVLSGERTFGEDEGGVRVTVVLVKQ